MSKPDNSVLGILGRLDEQRATELRAKMKEIEFRKDDYMRSWLEQYESYRMHNEKFGTNLKGIHPNDMPQYLERELEAEATRLEREQKEELGEKQKEELEKEELEKEDLEKEERENEDTSQSPSARYGFFDQKDDITKNERLEEMAGDKNLERDPVNHRYGFFDQKDEITKNENREAIDKEVGQSSGPHRYGFFDEKEQITHPKDQGEKEKVNDKDELNMDNYDVHYYDEGPQLEDNYEDFERDEDSYDDY